MPHLSRRLLGADAQVLPGALLLGGAFVILCDTIARSALSGEILGILTSLIGVAAFGVLMVAQPRFVAQAR